MDKLWVVLKYELSHILRSRWLLWVFLFLFALSFLIQAQVEDSQKSLLSMSGILLLFLPLMALLFSSLFWYQQESFTQIVLSMRFRRWQLLWGRWSALVLSMGGTSLIAIALPLVFRHNFQWQWFVFLIASFMLMMSMVSVSILIAMNFSDRLKGVSLSFAFWIYMAFLFDALLYYFISEFYSYPLEIPLVFLCALNPVTLVRLFLLMLFDSYALLGMTGLVIKNWVVGVRGMCFVFVTLFLWSLLPMLIATYRFEKKDL